MSDNTHDKSLTVKSSSELEKKNLIAFGSSTSDKVLKDQLALIPSQTPGRDAPIKPRSPYRELKVTSKKTYRDSPLPPSSEDEENNSVQVSERSESSGNGTVVRSERNGKSIPPRSVYDIGLRRQSDKTNSSLMSTPPQYDRVNPHYSHRDTHDHHHHHAQYYHQPNLASSGNGMMVGPPQGYHQASQYPNVIYQAPPYGHVHHQLPPPPVAPVAFDYNNYYDEMNDEEKNEARLIFKSKFASLKDNYPERKFDDYDFNLPLKVIHKIYEEHLKNISIESNSSTTKIFLVMMFLGIELFANRCLGVDLTGYTKNQMQSMKRYDRLLLELGEKYTGGSNNWPIEGRLIFLALINAVVIVVVKFACDKMGYKDSNGLVNMVNNMLGVDSMVETKPEPTVDPVTRTADPPVDSNRDLMGGVQSLMRMAGQAFGTNLGNNGGDLAETLGNLGATAIANSAKAKTPGTTAKPGTEGTGGAGGTTGTAPGTAPKSKRGVRFGVST